jgi:hypothetical protein
VTSNLAAEPPQGEVANEPEPRSGELPSPPPAGRGPGGGVAGVPELILYGRGYCHLCDEMLAALEVVRGEFSFAVTVLDVAADPALAAMYDERVPVLAAEGRELCHYFLDEAAVRQYLREYPGRFR